MNTNEPWNLTPQNKPNLFEKIDRLDPHRDWQIIIREKQSQRSNQQNARYWAFMTAFGAYLGYTKDEMHDLCRMKFLSEGVNINGVDMMKLKSSPKTSTKEFAEYSEQCEIWANSLGFVWGEG